MWRSLTDLQIGDADGLKEPYVVTDVAPRVVSAIEQWAETGAAPAKSLTPEDIEQFEAIVQGLTATEHMRTRPKRAPYGVLALDAHPLTAAIIDILLDGGVPITLDSVPSPVCSAQQLAEVRYQAARRIRPGQPVSRQIALLTSAYVADPARIAPLMREDQPFVVVSIGDYSVEISPVVIPGVTPCPTCQEAHRTAIDEARPILASQLRTKPVPPLSPALTSLAAALAVQTIAAFGYGTTDVPPRAVVLDTTTLRAGVRSWRFHPGCPCRYPAPLIN
ncbi:hypothetical protein [Bowdeniella massiliensis]|uniref:hypothetical protein n=1 Tax=Bowdeniella massiliensis TaxID=2932264 RepID=UPI00202960D4|nr:hypothetical protein [Bowdeniella massiliensis]